MNYGCAECVNPFCGTVIWDVRKKHVYHWITSFIAHDHFIRLFSTVTSNIFIPMVEGCVKQAKICVIEHLIWGRHMKRRITIIDATVFHYLYMSIDIFGHNKPFCLRLHAFFNPQKIPLSQRQSLNLERFRNQMDFISCVWWLHII